MATLANQRALLALDGEVGDRRDHVPARSFAEHNDRRHIRFCALPNRSRRIHAALTDLGRAVASPASSCVCAPNAAVVAAEDASGRVARIAFCARCTAVHERSSP
ncbi:hypothetical protein MRX96_002473 [Rhipicephalus microplus]